MELSEKNFLNVEELSEYLGSSLSTVYKLSQNGEIPAQKVGRQWRFSREKIDQWIASGQGGSSVCGSSLPLEQSAPFDASSKRESVGKGRGLNLGAIFTDEQRQTLSAFSLDSAPRLLTALATATGRKGLEKLLDLSAKELDAIATKLVAQM